MEGIESSTTGSDAQPTLRVGNIDGKISALCLHYDDLALARVVIHDTQKQYLDAKNFPDGMPQLIRRRRNGAFSSLT
jgi:lambda family phage minor tail protein L